MTIRNLDHLLAPRSIALIGASDREGSLGTLIGRNLREGGFEGRIMLVNPRYAEIGGEPCYPEVARLPEAPDLGVIATPPATVPEIVAALGERGARAAVVIAAGFDEGGKAEGAALRQAMLDAARPHLLRILGPNSLGLMIPGHGLNATFAHLPARAGRLAFITQSGAIMTGILDWAEGRDVGFSHLVSLGDMADVDFGDLLDYLAQDRSSSAILLYMEAVTHARKFMSAARAASRIKPVIVLKAGRHAAAARAITSHTGALAGADAVHEAAFCRAGMLRVRTLQELFDAASILATCAAPKGDRLAILTNGGGFGVLATDALMDEGGRLADLSPATMERLDRLLPSAWSRGNPVDILGDAPGRRYGDALAILMEDRAVDAVLVLNHPSALASSTEAARAVVEATGGRPRVPVIAGWVGESESVRKACHILGGSGLPVYATPDQAVRSFMHLVRHRRNQQALMQTPPSVAEEFEPDRAAARAVIEKALAAGRAWLSEPEAKTVLAAYEIPVVPTQVARSPEEAARLAAEIGFPAAIKILSPDVVHKSDIGGVALDLADVVQARAAAEAMLTRLKKAAPDARVEGFVVQPMIHRPRAEELILGAYEDPQFGPIILFGAGGTAAEIVADRALALPPLNLTLARDLMSRTRVHRLLQGYRDREQADLDAIALTLIKVAQLVIDFAEVAELDINPLLADEAGVIALDARIRIARADGPPERRLAIRPYPKKLEEDIRLGDGRALLLRPIRPEDEPALIAAFHRLSPQSVRLRFFAPMKELSHEAAVRLTQLDYDRQMALVLAEPGPAGVAEIHGVARLGADPDNEEAEFAIVVGDDMAGKGIGTLLMRRLIDYARRRGLKKLFGHVLAENHAMLALARKLGFEEHASPDEADIRIVRLPLRPAGAGTAGPRP
jgi:acetyltransferase